MPPIKTQLTTRLNLTSPIISAPMAGVATPELAAAVTGGGGLGSIGAGYASTQVLKEQIQKIRSSLNIPAGETVPIVVGFLGWILDRTELSDDPRLIAVLDERPAAVWFAFGVNLEKYIDQVHAYNSKTGRNTFIFVIVNSVDDARRAALHRVDAVVVQGTEAGGHGGADAPPLFVLLAAVLREFETTPGNKPLVIPAGGISTGAQIAALLAMGAAGVVLGTRFLFTTECGYPAAKKQALIDADLNATVRAMAFDEVNGTMGWPPNCDGRAIANGIIDDYKAGLSVEDRMAKFAKSAQDGDNSRLVVWAGVGVGLTDRINGAADVLRELHEETVEYLKRATRLLA
ncbi:Nitronate monooxygenase [Mycena sanguinolenta]|uniref:Nitronate monooxygenase n=1 Tax=Mycena sanguinolenta TaxID=230812 RepID=A0A8H7DBR5_9AGAR|nr:Nitronate monooxygenase [Mycena sanguinolenta]